MKLPVAAQWAALLILSAGFAGALELVHIPAALLLGPMVAAIILAVTGTTIKIQKTVFVICQGIVGAMIARSIPASVWPEVLAEWPIFLAGVVSVVLIAAVLGYILAKSGVLPGTTAVWGSSPGAAAAMTLMSAEFGADMRLVAFMQYTRVVIIAATATVVARLWVPAGGSVSADIVWFPTIHGVAFGKTLLLIAGCIIAGRFVRIPSAALLLPAIIGSGLEAANLITIELPQWLLALAYLVLGWAIGLRFSRETIRHAAHALPRVLVSIICLLAICGGLAALLVVFLGLDPLTAYLATSPGGADSIAIIASSTNVDLAFVMAMQTGRLITVMLTGPALAKFVAKRVEKHLAAKAAKAA